jgi:hypothetical protein
MSYEYYPVIDVLRTNISVTLGEFIKAHLKQSDYEAISHIAKIGNEAESFLDSLYERYGNDVEEAQIIDVAPVTPVVQESKVAKSSARREQEPKDKYNHMKVFIFKYIGGRGGRTRISDLANAFHNEFKHLFTETDYEIVSGSCTKWQHRMYDQVKTMRSQGMINPKTKGRDYRNYSLTVAGMKHYKKYASRLEKQLELPDMFEEG